MVAMERRGNVFDSKNEKEEEREIKLYLDSIDETP